MHRKEQLQKLVREWLDLGLENTCAPVDQFTSVKITHVGKSIEFDMKLRGKTTPVAKLYLGLEDNTEVTGMVIPGLTTPAMGLMLVSLETAIENN